MPDCNESVQGSGNLVNHVARFFQKYYTRLDDSNNNDSLDKFFDNLHISSFSVEDVYTSFKKSKSKFTTSLGKLTSSFIKDYAHIFGNPLKIKFNLSIKRLENRPEWCSFLKLQADYKS